MMNAADAVDEDDKRVNLLERLLVPKFDSKHIIAVGNMLESHVQDAATVIALGKDAVDTDLDALKVREFDVHSSPFTGQLELTRSIRHRR